MCRTLTSPGAGLLLSETSVGLSAGGSASEGAGVRMQTKAAAAASIAEMNTSTNRMGHT
jgi:hypothetical protein